MRIGIITEFFPRGEQADIRGGVEARAFHVAKHLAKKHEVVVLASRERGTPSRDEFLGIRVLRYGKERKYSQKGSLAERLSFILEGRKMKGKLNLVDGYNFVSYPVAWGISKQQKIPAVATYHDVWLGEWVKNIGAGGILGEILERYVLSREWDKFITVSGCTRDKLMERGISGERIEVIPSGIDLQMFEEVKAQKSHEPTICCIARLVEYKHVDDLLRALKVVKREIPEVRCKIIGSGPEEGGLQRLRKELELEENVEFLGFVERHREITRVLKSSHVFCLPSTVEGLGLVLLEAMAAHTPFVASEIPPLLETSGKKGGLFFKSRDWGDLANKLLLMLEDKGLQRRAAAEGHAHAQKYDWKIMASKIESVYQTL